MGAASLIIGSTLCSTAVQLHGSESESAASSRLHVKPRTPRDGAFPLPRFLFEYCGLQSCDRGITQEEQIFGYPGISLFGRLVNVGERWQMPECASRRVICFHLCIIKFAVFCTLVRAQPASVALLSPSLAVPGAAVRTPTTGSTFCACSADGVSDGVYTSFVGELSFSGELWHL